MDAKEFTKKYYVKRENTNCVKWDVPQAKDKIPMWVADADFKAPEEVVNNLCKKIKEGTYGYGFLPVDYYDVMINWNKKISNITYKKDWIRFSKGAIDGLTHIICALTKEGDGILMTTPIYHHFFHTIKNTKRKLVESDLINNNYHFEMDFEDIEKKIKKEKVKLMILCSPSNPVGRVWTKKELSKLFEITHKYNVIVVSDEVHSELIMPGNTFVPSLSFKKYQNEIITLNAESKTFSLALFQHAHIICPNKEWLKKIDEYQEYHDIKNPNAFNGLASYYSYIYGQDWLDGFKNTIYENYLYFKEELKDYCDVPDLQGSYLIYVDFSKSLKKKNAAKFLLENCNILSNPGDDFKKGYTSYARINLATSLSNVKQAVKQIKKALA